MSTPRMRAGVLGVALLALSACESGPSGPGALRGLVAGPSDLGAVTLEVVGPGIRGFEGEGSTQAFGAVIDAGLGRHRVVLVSPEGGQLRFNVRVDDVRAESPALTVVAAAGTDNLPRLSGGIRARIQR